MTAVGENSESWHMAYHGIKGGAIRRMLDKGELLFPGINYKYDGVPEVKLGVNFGTRFP